MDGPGEEAELADAGVGMDGPGEVALFGGQGSAADREGRHVMR